MSKNSKKPFKAPTSAVATTAAIASETNAAGVVLDAAATPPGLSDPGGTNTPASSGVAAGEAPTNPVKPHDEDGTSTPGMAPEAANGQSAPEAEAAASGGLVEQPEPSQGDAASGAGNPAGPADRPAEQGLSTLTFRTGGFVEFGSNAPAFTTGVDLATAQDVGVISWGDRFAALSDSHPHTYRFFSRLIEEEPEIVPTSLFVTSKTNGFRRGGVVHSPSGTTFAPGDYTPEQLEAWLGEPELTVEIV
ncbi:hypothetical protein [Shinella sp. G-2]|uniref:hypothetical protein n=1 Tax=Shinella sp. G-2 TaxID=3133141 RepID=UPI003D012C52